jgi:hypothetical protein
MTISGAPAGSTDKYGILDLSLGVPCPTLATVPLWRHTLDIYHVWQVRERQLVSEQPNYRA